MDTKSDPFLSLKSKTFSPYKYTRKSEKKQCLLFAIFVNFYFLLISYILRSSFCLLWQCQFPPQKYFSISFGKSSGFAKKSLAFPGKIRYAMNVKQRAAAA